MHDLHYTPIACGLSYMCILIYAMMIEPTMYLPHQFFGPVGWVFLYAHGIFIVAFLCFVIWKAFREHFEITIEKDS